MNLLTGTQQALLLQRKRDDETGILDAVKSIYSVLIAVDRKGEIETHRLPPGSESPFERVKTFLEAEADCWQLRSIRTCSRQTVTLGYGAR